MTLDLLFPNFAEIVRTPADVDALNQAILDLAVRGRLVAQDSGDEPASKILEQVEEKRSQLRHEGSSFKPSRLSAMSRDEEPFELPDGWVWARLGNLVLSVQTGPFGSSLHKSDYVAGGIPVVNPANIQNGQIRALSTMTVSEKTKSRLARYVLESGDIVLGRRGEMGRCALVTPREAGWLCGSGSFVLRTSEAMCQEFLVRVIRSPSMRAYLSSGSVGSTMENLNHRIVNRA